MNIAAEISNFAVWENEVRGNESSQKVVAYNGFTISVGNPGILCICCPQKLEHPRDLENALASMFQYQWNSLGQCSGIQIALNEAGHFCFLFLIEESQNSLVQKINESVKVCSDILEGASVEFSHER